MAGPSGQDELKKNLQMWRTGVSYEPVGVPEEEKKQASVIT